MSTGTPRWIMHLDMDACYAAVEQRDDPAGGRGVAATCSYEARRFGIRSAMPINEAYRRCPDAVYLRPRMAHYLVIAQQIRAVMDDCAPVVEPLSIDEAFLDVSGRGPLIGPPELIGRRIKAAIRTAVGLTASVGIAPNRLVAKRASDFGKPDGLLVVFPEQVLDFVGGQPVGVLRGVGRWTLPTLERLGLRTVADLRRLTLTQLQAALGSRAATSLYLKIRFAGFETHTRQRRFERRSDDARTLLATAWSLYTAGRWDGKPVRLIGLGVAELGPPERVQPDLFDEHEIEDGGPQCPRRDERIHQLRQRDRRLVQATLDPQAGKQRPQDVEVFLQPHLWTLQIFPMIALGHVQIVVQGGPRGSLSAGQAAQAFGHAGGGPIDDRRVQPLAQDRVPLA